jgi:flagellar hook assembly protein FlgD
MPASTALSECKDSIRKDVPALLAKGASDCLRAFPLMKRVLAAILVAAVCPPAAAAADVRLVSRDERVGVARAGAQASEQTRAAPIRFNLIGLHWQGSGRVAFRTALRPGRWSPWRPARPEAEDLPDPGTEEAAATTGWKVGNPFWTGPARYVQYRTAGRVTRLRAHFLWSPPFAAFRTLARPDAPAIIPRAAWGADEAIVRAPPFYADSVRFSVVHHTAGTNSYTAANSAAIVRGIQRYHVISNGWNDIGYNFLVDKYGQVFEGRGGGIDRNVVGAHAAGFNTGSTGVAVLGTYASSPASGSALAALEQLLAWRLDVAHADPLATVTAVSRGNPKYPAGTAISLRAVSGHRDTGPTTCPGNGLYSQLSSLASTAAARGLPKLYDPAVFGGLGGPARFTARLSQPLPWSVSVADSSGNQVAGGTGSGQTIDWTWDARAHPAGVFTYTIAAGPDVTPATGTVPGPPPLELSGLVVSPAAFTPNGDGRGDTTKISFTLSVSALVTASVLDSAGTAVRTLVSKKGFGPGRNAITWDGTRANGTAVPDGAYRLRLTAETAFEQATRFGDLVVDRTLGHFSGPVAFSPNADGRRDVATLTFQLTRDALVRVRILAGSRVVATLASGTLPPGAQQVVWDGRTAGRRAADRTYTAVVTAQTPLGIRKLTRPLRLDTRRPVVRIRSLQRVPGGTRIRLLLSERAKLTIRYRGKTAVVERRAGRVQVRLAARVRSVRVVAVDAALNRSRPAVR